MSLTELLNELPLYIVLPFLLLIILGVSLVPVAILHYADRNLKERKAALVAIIICSIIGSLLTLGNIIYSSN
ncbi:MAG TPA: hypothetical protein VFF14_12455 [Candidatus Deferrimicrobium sp.]|nr:hypothetical protein [Candidatus Deferrimicrobium sp.]